MNVSSMSADRVGGLRAILGVAAVVLAALIGAASAHADYGLENFDVRFENADGSVATQAGSHPYAMTTSFTLNYTGVAFAAVPDGEAKDLFIDQVPGFVGDPGTTPKCTTAEFLDVVQNASRPSCPPNTAVGVMAAQLESPVFYVPSGVYNLVPPPGVPARIGFVVLNIPVTVDVGVKESQPHNVVASLRKIPQPLKFFGSSLTLWGNPAESSHDPFRGECLNALGLGPVPTYKSLGECPADIEERPFLTTPGDCSEPLPTFYRSNSWQKPDVWVEGDVLIHDDATPSNPESFNGCAKLGFSPVIQARPTTTNAATGTGLDFAIDFNQEGLENTSGIAQSTIKRAEITLAEGITVNPSLAEGIDVCSPGDLADEAIGVEPGSGCPQGSKIGTVSVETPLLESTITGQVYLAKPFDNLADDSLIAFYIVLKDANNGVLVKLPAKVEPDEITGQLVTTVENIPQLPFSHFSFHFREGQRAPLIAPSGCGVFQTSAEFTPWARPSDAVEATATFEITDGVSGGPCPPGGAPPFNPSFEAGSLNNSAGSFSPFTMRLQRGDGEQDLTKFSSILPPGVLGSLAGVEKCSTYAVAVAKAKTGLEEQANPSCPASSQIGSTVAGAGVGSALTYVPGKIYLSGPYKGAPLSVVAITPAVAGPFDAGTVAVRLGLTLNPTTAEVEVDGAASDPIPHILNGIVLKLRDLRVNVDRPNFILNPTNCDESQTKATLFGSYLDVFNPADDLPVDLAARYQAASCLNLGFKPKLGLKLKGGTRRGNFPGLKAHYKPFSGHANIKDLVVRLPRSAFLEQGHIRTICTRVQFAADNCPKGAQYGYIRAWTPLLDEPLQGPVWLRSSNHKLPDLVFDLKGIVDVEVQTRIDSVRGGIRARVEDAPDAPISRVILNMQGGKKGLIVNSRNLCTKRKGRANAKGTGQNGKQFTRRPVLRPQCGRKAKRSSHSRVSRVAGASAVG